MRSGESAVRKFSLCRLNLKKITCETIERRRREEYGDQIQIVDLSLNPFELSALSSLVWINLFYQTEKCGQP